MEPVYSNRGYNDVVTYRLFVCLFVCFLFVFDFLFYFFSSVTSDYFSLEFLLIEEQF